MSVTDLDSEPKEVIGSRTRTCPKSSTRQHHEFLVLRDETRVDAADVIQLLDAGAIFFVMTRPGMPAFRGEPERLLVQHQQCGLCGEDVVFA